MKETISKVLGGIMTICDNQCKGYKRVTKYVYQYYNKYVIKQKQQTLYITTTLQDALQKKHELLQQGKLRPLPRGQHRNPENRYITKTQSNTYAIRKMVNGYHQHFGTYKTLEDAREERDYLESIEWDYDNME